ncbi:MAG: amidase [Salinisphaera sp.]|jgi:amidase|nr:amidase [Salinisphaera sp.]
MSEIHHLSASDLAQQIANGEIGSRQALEHYLARVDTFNQTINAVVALDVDGARRHADEADAALARGDSWGALHGVPMTVKDTFEVAGMPTVVGEPKLKDYVSRRDAVCVSRLKNAGAVIFGKTNTPRMAQDVQTYNPVYGTTCNPWDIQRTSGGSSGGAAAALAAGLTPLEIGSDLAGSIRTPASWCGVYGHKPSYGLVPLRGHVPAAPGTQAEPDLCVAGPLARSATDLELALGVLAGADELDASAWQIKLPPAAATELAEFRVGYLFSDRFAPIAEAVAAKLQAVVDTMAGHGTVSQPLDTLPGGFDDSYDLYDRLLNAMIGGSIPDKLYTRARRGARLYSLLRKTGRGTLGGFSARATDSHRAWIADNEQRQRLRYDWHRLFADHDVILLPSVAVPAIPHTHEGNLFDRRIDIDGKPYPYTHLFRWIAPATVAGLPATVVPIGITDGGLPVGLQVVGDYGRDRTTIAFAKALADAGIGYTSPPDFT